MLVIMGDKIVIIQNLESENRNQVSCQQKTLAAILHETIASEEVTVNQLKFAFQLQFFNHFIENQRYR